MPTLRWRGPGARSQPGTLQMQAQVGRARVCLCAGLLGGWGGAWRRPGKGKDPLGRTGRLPETAQCFTPFPPFFPHSRPVPSSNPHHSRAHPPTHPPMALSPSAAKTTVDRGMPSVVHDHAQLASDWASNVLKRGEMRSAASTIPSGSGVYCREVWRGRVGRAVGLRASLGPGAHGFQWPSLRPLDDSPPHTHPSLAFPSPPLPRTPPLP
jgi:hypothetical protein